MLFHRIVISKGKIVAIGSFANSRSLLRSDSDLTSETGTDRCGVTGMLMPISISPNRNSKNVFGLGSTNISIDSVLERTSPKVAGIKIAKAITHLFLIPLCLRLYHEFGEDLGRFADTCLINDI